MKNGNNKKNYMVLNGVRIELSDQLVQQLQDGIKDDLIKDSNVNEEKKINKVEELFKRADRNHNDEYRYKYVYSDGLLSDVQDIECGTDNDRHDNINYFPSIKEFDCEVGILPEYFHRKNLMQRKMMKFSLLHDGYKIDWNDNKTVKYTICYYIEEDKMFIEPCCGMYEFDKVYFHTEEIAQEFINENGISLFGLFNLEKDLFKNIENYCEN